MPTSKLKNRVLQAPKPATEIAAANQAKEERLAEWLALRHEEALEPDLPIIDSHHHLWWRPGFVYLLDEFLADANTGHNIRGSVFVDCGAFYRKTGPAHMAPLGQLEAINGIAAMAASGTYGKTLACAGIVSTADLTLGPAAAEVLDAQIAASGGRFKGIRLIVKWDPDEQLNNGRVIVPRDLMQDADFRAGFATLGPRKLSFDTMIYHPQIPELAERARAFPDSTIILDHSGGLVANTRTYAARKDEATALWRKNMAELAKCPNVYVKLGGLGMPYLCFGHDKLPKPASSQELAESWGPILKHCIDVFGPNRCMFESNFPPDKETCSYPVIWNAFKRVAASYSAQEKQALFYGAAAKAYRLNLD